MPVGDIDSERARRIRAQMPSQGLFAGHEWRVSPAPLQLAPKLGQDLESLGRVLLQFYRAVNLLYRRSVEGKQPEWVSRWLDQGKPRDLIGLQRSAAFKSDLPRVIRPDLLLTDDGMSVTELDSVPGGIGLTAWLNEVYAKLDAPEGSLPDQTAKPQRRILGGAQGMLTGFADVFGTAPTVHIVISEESSTYRPEMEWVVGRLGTDRFKVQSANFSEFREGDAVYRFFELFDVPNVPAAGQIFQLAERKQIRLSPPPKPIFEEKMLLALLWNRNLQDFWRQELGERFFERLLQLTPYTWLVDPSPIPPHAAIPELNLTSWHQLKTLSLKQRELILKVSGFSERAWGARGVYLGSDLPHADWAAAVDAAIAGFERSPYVLQRYRKPALVSAAWFDFEKNQTVPMQGRVRLCPFYFVAGDGDAARAVLGGVLATICPADKKIIHGMKEAIFAPCSV